MSSLKNTSFFFIPFAYSQRNDFHLLVSELEKGDKWCPVSNNNKYMLKYVASKFDSSNKKSCQCFHFTLNDSFRKAAGLGDANDCFHTQAHTYRKKSEPVNFRIASVQLFCFSTTIGVLAFEICFEDNDLIKISNNQYYLKKVSKEKIYSDNESTPFTMLDISEKLMSPFSKIDNREFNFEFFFYLNKDTERANVFTYIESEPQDNFDKELFFLKRCFSEGFIYTENNGFNNEETYKPSEDIIWGISPEAAVCITTPAVPERLDFIHNDFYPNFCEQYLFMYVFLLHQKYMLYLFQTRIGIGMYNDLEKLEEYQQQLYEFETDFVYSCVSEVPQYQNLYERVFNSFRLERMFKDVYEPLTLLGKNRKEKAEDEQKKRDKNVERALFLFSILSVFSAFIDSFDFAGSFFSKFLGERAVAVVQYTCVGLIVIIAVAVFITFFHKDKRK